MKILRRFTQYYRPYRALFLLDMIAATVVAALDLIFPLSTKWFYSWIDGGPEYIPTIVVAAVVLLALYVIRMIGMYIMGYWGHVLGTRMEGDMRRDLFIHIQNMPFKYFDENRTGTLMSRLVGDLREVSEMAHHGPEDLFISIIMIIGSFFILVSMNWLLTIILFVAPPFEKYC